MKARTKAGWRSLLLLLRLPRDTPVCVSWAASRGDIARGVACGWESRLTAAQGTALASRLRCKDRQRSKRKP
eukprot:4317996-Alexandrium_andersonii.AAC.1